MKKTNYIPELDGLRGIAILMVICYHYFPGTILTDLGWMGVDLFFVLSGFLITSRLLPFLKDPKLLSKFYWNRILRIFPLYFLFLTVFFICWFAFASADTLSSYPLYTDHWWQFFIFFENWIFIRYSSIPINSLHHLWSLAIEEQFYLLFPFLIILIKRPKTIAWVLFSLILFIVACRCFYYDYYSIGVSENFKLIYWNTFLRIDSLLIGALLFTVLNYCKLPKSFHRLYGGVALLALAASIFGIYYYREKLMCFPFFDTVGFTLIAILFSYLIYKTIKANNKYLLKLTSQKWLVYIGKISFGLYVFHWPILLMGTGLINKILNMANYQVSDSTIHITNVCLGLIISFALSHFSSKYFESYFLKWKSKYLKMDISN